MADKDTSTCAVSVVIPMYNAERYIVECLDSVLAQTLQDFEVVLVNDCSTDNCRQVAESCLEKFGGRLKIYDNEKNCRAGGTRNNGLRYATGEYVFFLDADDLILPEGLEKVYKLAKRFDVDVVNITTFYSVDEAGQNPKRSPLTKPTPQNEHILETNVEWRVKGLLKDSFTYAPWRRLLRRKFMMDNEIFFPEKVKKCEDIIWTHGLMFCAKKVIHVPFPFYLYRKSIDSLSRQKRTSLESINSRLDSLIYGIKWIDDMMNKASLFTAAPEYRYAILEHIAEKFFIKLHGSSVKVQPSEIYRSVREEFGHEFGEYEVLVPILCTLIANQRKIIAEDKLRLAELESNLNQGASA